MKTATPIPYNHPLRYELRMLKKDKYPTPLMLSRIKDLESRIAGIKEKE